MNRFEAQPLFNGILAGGVLSLLAIPALVGCSPSLAAEKHGDYDVAVTSIDRVREWQDPLNMSMRYSANRDGIIVLVTITVTTPNGQISLGDSEVKARDGKIYKSNRITYNTSWPKKEPQTGEVTLPFILPATADIDTLTLEGRTTFDIAKLAARAKAAKP